MEIAPEIAPEMTADKAAVKAPLQIATISEIRNEPPTLADHPLWLWLRQQGRQLAGRSLIQDDLLDRLIQQRLGNPNLIGIILFGSLASRTHRWNSDIDLIFIYQEHEPAAGLINYYESGIEIQYFYATLAILEENMATVPYLLHMFAEGDVWFDRHGTVTPVVEEIKAYFAAHPTIATEWARLKEQHQIEKRGSQCQQTTIMERWDELEAKYGDGLHRRTFFVTPLAASS